MIRLNDQRCKTRLQAPGQIGLAAPRHAAEDDEHGVICPICRREAGVNLGDSLSLCYGARLATREMAARGPAADRIHDSSPSSVWNYGYGWTLFIIAHPLSGWGTQTVVGG